MEYLQGSANLKAKKSSIIAKRGDHFHETKLPDSDSVLQDLFEALL
jgi:hypothetical protein